ncbi:hypothetical protein [Streptacidiphilus sp. MAP5-52]|uniref:hypothetical protein n=1 Tax=Streptacidiphilus sp. MAP5-52 TaxID=3156267 RepID=UPI003512EECC
MATALTRLDSRLEAAFGDTIPALYAAEARADAATARTLKAHRDLVKAESDVAFQRVRLLIVADRQQRVDDAHLDAIDEQLERLEDAADLRDEREGELAQLLQVREAVAQAMRTRTDAAPDPLTAAARAAVQEVLRRRH